MRILKIISFAIISFLCLNLYAQDELKWKESIDKLVAVDHGFQDGDDLFIFTGSSSILMWKNIHDQFPDYNIVNNGFGGSQMHELQFFLNELVINYKPSKVFIYEGDNDISAGKSNRQIMRSTKRITQAIKKKLPGTKVYFISPKPSIARWDLKEQYVSLNNKLEKYANRRNLVYFIDVWNPMLEENGEIIKDLFISDGLHMNEKGYKIWAKVVQPYLEN